MSSHHTIPACTVPKAPKTTGTASVRQCHMRLISTLKSLYFANFSACFLPMLPSAGQLISIRRQVFVFLFLRQMSGRLALIFLAVGMVVSHIIVMSFVSTSLSLHWNPKMMTNMPVNDGGHLIVSISVVHWCQSTTACHNVVDCFQGYTAHVASRTDITI